MDRFSPSSFRQISSYILFIIAFVTVSYVVQQYQSYISLLLDNGSAIGAALFVFLTALFVVFVIPLDIVFLIPLGVSLWGPFATALLSILGWVFGASIAFGLARQYGPPLVTRLIGSERVARLAERLPKGDFFWPIVFLRLLIPVDVLSYALGLFSILPWNNYFFATLIGVTPFGFFFAFVGVLPFWYQIFSFAIVFMGVLFFLARYTKRNN